MINIGQVINNKQLCDIFKCSPQGGMRRSHKTNSLVIVSDHTRGIYEDRWESNILHYTGMGLKGDQDINFAQNKTVGESLENGVALHLFEVFEAGKYLYQGRVKLARQPYQDRQDGEDGKARKVWMFPLKLKDIQSPTSIPAETYKKYKEKKEKSTKTLSDVALKKRVKNAPKNAVRREVSGFQYQASVEIKEWAKRLALGICDLCGGNAPFSNKHGSPYLEGHHIVWLANGGEDILGNVVALCPNCHRKMHVLNKQKDVNILSEKVRRRAENE